MSQDTISSPCIGVCTVGDNGLCMGCFRSMEEITNWLRLSLEEKIDIIEQIPIRLEAMFT